MAFKVVNHINTIVSIKTLTEVNSSLCVDKCFTILKNLCDRCVTLMNKKLDVYEAYRHKTNFN